MSTRDAYMEKLKAQLDEWNAELDKLSARARKARAESRIEYESAIEELSRRRDQARQKLEELRAAGGDAWTDLKQGAEDVREAMNEALRKVRSRFESDSEIP